MTKESRILLIPNNISSVETYFHFLLGYFVPAVAWIDRAGARRVTVRDCGPMNPWFDLLRPAVDVEVVPAGVALKRYVSRSQPRVVLPQMDNPLLFDTSVFGRVAEVLRGRVGADASRDSGIVVIRRGSPDRHYATPGAEVRLAGAALRSMSNVDEVAAALTVQAPVSVLDPAAMPPDEQIRGFASCSVLVGQHGAGLANMLWMKPGGAIVEIQPPVREDVQGLFTDLARTLGLGVDVVSQDSLHGPAPLDAVVSAVRSPSPAPAGGAPARARLVREVRRRAKVAELRVHRWPTVGPLARAARRLTGP